MQASHKLILSMQMPLEAGENQNKHGSQASRHDKISAEQIDFQSYTVEFLPDDVPQSSDLILWITDHVQDDRLLGLQIPKLLQGLGIQALCPSPVLAPASLTSFCSSYILNVSAEQVPLLLIIFSTDVLINCFLCGWATILTARSYGH